MSVVEMVESIELIILDPRRPGYELWEECRFTEKGGKKIVHERPKSKVKESETVENSFAKKMRNELPFEPEDYSVLIKSEFDSDEKIQKFTLHLHTTIFIPRIFDHTVSDDGTIIRYKWVKV